MNEDEKEYCWSVKLGHTFKETLKPFTMPRIRQTFEFLPLSIRYLKYHRECQKQNIQAHMDFFRPVPIRQIYGAPIGGIGTGSIGRSFSGDFCRFSLVPGLYDHGLAEANMFTVCIRKKGKTVYQQALSVRRSKLGGLKAWNMSFSGDHATYHAIYPESWTVYDLPGQNVRLTCHQLSPVIPHDYKNSALPVGLFEWSVENNNTEDIEVSIMFSWQAGSATDEFEIDQIVSGPFELYSAYETNVTGVVINQTINKMPLQYCVAAEATSKCQVTYNCQFDPTNCESGTSLWMDLLHDGSLDNNKCKLTSY
jgi:non-lysosomal glucosylceramidase